MVSWRITKYDPKDRDQNGVFLKESWTSFSDVGKVVDGSKERWRTISEWKMHTSKR